MAQVPRPARVRLENLLELHHKTPVGNTNRMALATLIVVLTMLAIAGYTNPQLAKTVLRRMLEGIAAIAHS